VLTFALGPVPHQLVHARASPSGKAVAVGLLIFAAVYIGVIAHEGTHALTGWGVGRKITGVKLGVNLTGGTDHVGPEKGLGRIMTAFTGYLGPSGFGLSAAGLISTGHGKVVLPLALVFLLLILLQIRNLFGVVCVLASGTVLVSVLHYGTAKAQLAAAHGLSWVLLVFGVGLALWHRGNAKDALTLYELTRIPRPVWGALWIAGTVAALWAGAHLLA
jgi:hypothetical protein